MRRNSFRLAARDHSHHGSPRPPHARARPRELVRAASCPASRCRGSRKRPRRRSRSSSTRRSRASSASTSMCSARCRHRALRRQHGARGRRAGRPGLCRTSVRRLLAAARRRPGASPRRGDRPRRAAPRHRLQGLGPDAVLARRRRQGGGRADAARGADRRGHARARHPDHARARRRRHRRAGAARDGRCPARCSRVSRPATSASARSSSSPRAATSSASASSPSTPSPATMPISSARRSLPRPARARRRATGEADRAVDEHRLHPRRDEHRQHDDLGRDDRLRAVRVRRGLRPGGGVQLDRYAGPLRVRQPAGDRPLEPGALRRDAAAAARRRRAARARRGDARDRRVPGAVPTSPAHRPARQARPRRGACRLDGPDARLAEDWLALLQAGGADFTLAWRRLAEAAEGDDAPLRALFADASAPDAWLERWRERCAREDDTAAGAPMPVAAERRAGARCAPARRQPGDHPAQSSRRGSTLGGLRRRRPAAFRAPPCRAAASVRRAPPEDARYAEPAPADVTACYQTFCGT